MNDYFTIAAQARLKVNHKTYASADLLQNGKIINGNISMSDTDAEVSVDGTANIRRTFSMSVPDAAEFLPLTVTSDLSPFLTEIRVWSGVYYEDGTVDRWPIFTGGINDPGLKDNGDLQLSITANDRAQYISDRRFPFPYTITAGTLVTVAIQAIVSEVLPNVTFNAGSSTATIPAAVVIDQLEDRWQHCNDLAASAGLEVYFDGFGVCNIQPIPDPDKQDSVWRFQEGATATLLEVDQTLSGTDSYSHAAAYSTGVDGTTPVRSDVYDTDSTSPTYFDPDVGSSAFGDRIIALSSDLITTQTQADTAATALLARKKRSTVDVSFSTVPISGLDEHDVIRIDRQASNIASFFMLESFNIPITPDGVMTAKCRSQRI